ncbi:MAG: glycosyltransferase family 87 protein [Chloroflexi bacterium]|nr:glycosyltransferase family 87 protein [Chloroflexota bacterium]
MERACQFHIHMKDTLKKILEILVPLIFLGGMIFVRTQLSFANFDYKNSNFSFFWLAGRMLLDGENPYDQAQYLAGHATYKIEWQPNKIFPYPLPLAIFCVPLGFLSIEHAYILWTVVTLVIIAITIFILLRKWESAAHHRLLIPIFAFTIFFGPLYLTLRTGAIGAFTLLIILSAILLLEKEKKLPAGIILSLTMLKPPQGLTILILAAVWFLARRDWKAIFGMAIGGVLLIMIGLIQDPLWIDKFRGASAAVMDRTQGIQSNVWAFAYLICKGAAPCSTLLGGTLALILLGLGGFFLWQQAARVKVTAWEAFNVILPIAFVSTIYLWAYDQLVYIIPIVWIVGTLVERTKSYVYAFLFLITLDLFSLYALSQHASTSKDLWSLGTTIIVLGMVMGLLLHRIKLNSTKDIPLHA